MTIEPKPFDPTRISHGDLNSIARLSKEFGVPSALVRKLWIASGGRYGKTVDAIAAHLIKEASK